jgi:hypothetical protein
MAKGVGKTAFAGPFHQQRGLTKGYWYGELGTLEGKLHHFEITPVCTFDARGPKGEGSTTASPDSSAESILSTNPLKLVVLYSYGSGENDVFTSSVPPTPSHGYYFFRCNIPHTNDKVLSGVVTI